MAGDKYLYLNRAVVTEKATSQLSLGVADAGKIPALDATGRLDSSMMPVGVEDTEIDYIVAFETLAAGDFVNIFNSSGATKCRKADASVAGKEAQGFVLAGFSSSATAAVYRLEKLNNQRTGMTLGTAQYLSVTVPGGTQETVPSATGQVVQLLGISKSATELITATHDIVVRA